MSVVTIEIEKKDDSMDELVCAIRPYSTYERISKSAIGIDTLTFILTAVQLLIAMLSIPALSDAISKKTVILGIDGCKRCGTLKEITAELKARPEFLSEVKAAYQNNSISFEGNVKLVNELKELIGDIIDGE